ncbi:hypothetical protein HYE82_29385 [Streptomyces sp. BR123]|uniref:DUF6056 family protein n=1 Tax=Streptomyces sp. BR123 TaxID=2749828 RepID=UPI0015C48E6A|nr:DUF6056 family protein [Streptomyces sp. BR123]NXY98416.1 hypothetical protein [Streptomyces sp. BR123]
MGTAAMTGEGVRGHPSAPGRASAARRARLRRLLLPGLCATVVAAAGALIAVGCFLGLYVRPTSDDWCAAWKSRDLGVLGITADFYTTQNGRITNALLSGLVYADGLTGIKVLPTVIAVTFTAGLVLLGREFVRLLGGRPRVLPLTACALVVQALLYFAGTRSYQVLLWAPATISHTLPSVIGVWALLLAVHTVRHRSAAVRAAGFSAAFLTAFAIGTLSEPFALVSGLLAAAAGLSALLPPGPARIRRRPFLWCLLWCAGLLCGLAVLYTSPGARWRRAQQPERESMLSAAELRATFEDWLRMWDAVTGQWAYLGAAAVGVLLGIGLRIRPRGQDRGSPPVMRRKLPLPVLLLPVPVVLLGSFAVVAGLRSGYGPTGWTYARTWTSYLLAMELALCGYGALLGAWAARRPTARAATRTAAATAVGAGAVAAGCLALASTAALVPNVRQLTTATVTRAAAWDAQNARIRAEAARGAADAGYTPLPIGNLAEPFFTGSHERDWVAACVAKWYGLDRVHHR